MRKEGYRPKLWFLRLHIKKKGPTRERLSCLDDFKKSLQDHDEEKMLMMIILDLIIDFDYSSIYGHS